MLQFYAIQLGNESILLAALNSFTFFKVPQQEAFNNRGVLFFCFTLFIFLQEASDYKPASFLFYCVLGKLGLIFVRFKKKIEGRIIHLR